MGSLVYEWSMTVQNNVAQYRSKYDLTQQELAVEVDVSRQTIHSIEAGKYNPSLELALKLAEQFEITVEDLFQLE